MRLIKLQLLLLILLLSPPELWSQTWDPFEGSPQEYLQKGQPEEALRIMKSNPKWISLGDSRGRTPLHYAVNLGNKEVVLWLLGNGADVNAAANKYASISYSATPSRVTEIRKRPHGETALFYVKTAEMAELLLKRGAEVNAINASGETPLFLTPSLEVAKCLIAYVPDLEMTDNYGQTALQSISKSTEEDAWRVSGSAKNGLRQTRSSIAFALIEAGANYDLESAICLGDLKQVKRKYRRGPEDEYSSALETAVRVGQVEICKFLFEEESVDFSNPKKEFGSLFHSALSHPKIVKLFIENGADVNATLSLSGGMSGMHIIGFEALVIHHAVNIGAPTESIKLILDAGAGPFDECESIDGLHDQDADLVTPLDVAFYQRGFYDNSEIVLCLVSHPKFEMDAKRERQESFDRLLCGFFGMKNSSELVRILLEKGADPKYEFNGFTALEANWLAFEVFTRKEALRTNEECLQVAKLLISHGTKQGLMTAIMFEDEAAAVTLQKAGGKLRHEKLEYIAMAKCIKERRVKLLNALLDSGIRVRKGPLYWAACFGDADIVRLLLQYGADIDGNGERYIDSLGMESPPLHGAVRAGNSEIVEILLLNGADPEAKDSKGRTPLQTCKNSAQRIEMQKIFTKHAGASDQ